MTLERWFRRKRPKRNDDDNSPSGLWLKCDNCDVQIYRKDLVANAYVCPECDHHYRMPVEERIDLLADTGSFERWSGHLEPADILDFVDTEGYPERLERAQQRQARPDAVLTGSALLEEEAVALVVMDFSF